MELIIFVKPGITSLTNVQVNFLSGFGIVFTDFIYYNNTYIYIVYGQAYKTIQNKIFYGG